MRISGKSRIGIIGGKGRTGRQFARLFRDLVCRLLLEKKKTRARNRALFESCDLLVFAVAGALYARGAESIDIASVSPRASDLERALHCRALNDNTLL